VDKSRAIVYNYIWKMPKLLARLIFTFFSNIIALKAASYFVKGFEIAPDLISLSLVAAIFTLLNIFIKPIFKLILSPIIILTFGLGILLVNAIVLYLLDFLLENITIDGVIPLIYATLIVSLVNFIVNFSAKRLYKETP
jgi:putative membrane protein